MKKGSTIFLSGFLYIVQLQAQPVSFSHLTTANGLSDNNVKCITTDKNGLLWLGSDKGLDMFDGSRVTHFNSKNQPSLPSDNINILFCDSHNNIWVGSSGGIVMLDSNRKIQPVVLPDSLKNVKLLAITETKKYGVVIMTGKGHFVFNKPHWKPLQIPTELYRSDLSDIVPFREDGILVSRRDKEIIIFDYKKNEISFRMPLWDITSVCPLTDSTIAAADYHGDIYLVNILRSTIIKKLSTVKIVNGDSVSTSISKIRRSADGRIVVTTIYGGILLLDPVTVISQQYTHDFYDPFSISSNNTQLAFCESNGNIFVATANAGVSYFHPQHTTLRSKQAFWDGTGQVFDGYINAVDKDKNGHFWLAAYDGLIEWEPLSGYTKLYTYLYPIVNLGRRPIQVNTVCVDDDNQVWVGTNGGAVATLNRATGSFTTYDDGFTSKKNYFEAHFVNTMAKDAAGVIWVTGRHRVYKLYPKEKRFEIIQPDSLSGKLPNTAWSYVYPEKDKVWMAAAGHGVFSYDQHSKKLTQYSKKEGLISDLIHCIFRSSAGEIFFGSKEGMSILYSNGELKNYTVDNGLRNNVCNGFAEDSAGNIWINNETCLICFDPVKKTFRYLNEQTNLMNGKLLIAGFTDVSTGLQYWGTQKGINWFNPMQLSWQKTDLRPLIYKIKINDSVVFLTSKSRINLPRQKNNLGFQFTALNLYRDKELFYQYQLQGADKKWITVKDESEIHYNSLPPGTYIFLLKVSSDGVEWTDSSNSITVIIHPAFWQTWWFKTLVLLLLAGLAWWLYRQRIKKIRADEKFKSAYEKKIAEVEMQALRAQMNPHFMFNSLNSINNFILKNDPDNASGYLTKFSRLMRLILDNSRSEWVLLENELRALDLYIQLESVRFDNSFDYSIEVAKDVNIETVLVPPLIIQPYVENAIWHGLMHKKETGGRLDIRLWKNGSILSIEIEDNGVGREEAKRLKSKTATKQKSHGMQITAERMEIVNKVYNVAAGVGISDLKNETGNTGTRVLITLKYKTNDSDNS